jgi:hypothetical protein
MTIWIGVLSNLCPYFISLGIVFFVFFQTLGSAWERMGRVDAMDFEKDGAPLESSNSNSNSHSSWPSPADLGGVFSISGWKSEREVFQKLAAATKETKKGPSASGTGSSNQVDTDRPHWAPAIERLKPSWKRLARKTRFQPAQKTYVGNSGSHGFFLLFPLVPQSPTLRGLLRKPEATLAPVWTRAVTPKSCNVSRKGGRKKWAACISSGTALSAGVAREGKRVGGSC